MKKTLLAITLCSGLLLADAPKLYINMAPIYLTHDKKDNGVKSDLNSHAFKWTLGSVLTRSDGYTLAIEGSALLGIEGKSKTRIEQNSGNGLTNAKIRIDKLYNINLKAMVPLTHQTTLNGYMGATRANTIAVADNYYQENPLENSLSYGVGLEYQFHPQVSLYTNYMQYYSDLSTFEIGLGFWF